MLQAVFYYETQSTDHQPTGTWHRPCYVPVKGLATTFTITNDAADTSALRMARAGVESGLAKPDDKKCAKNAALRRQSKEPGRAELSALPAAGRRRLPLHDVGWPRTALRWPGESVKVQLP
ncbi:MAG: hypothetical protein WDN04_27620 [Rhodospirillales bacterium]